MKIAIDMDGVLADINPSINEFHNLHYYTHFTLADYTEYPYSEIWKCSHKEMVERIQKYYASPAFTSMKPVKGSVDGVHFLKKNIHLS